MFRRGGGVKFLKTRAPPPPLAINNVQSVSSRPEVLNKKFFSLSRSPKAVNNTVELSPTPLLLADSPYIGRLQNSPYFCVFKYARAVKQKVWNEAENREPHTPVRLLRHALPISLLILRKKTDCFAV